MRKFTLSFIFVLILLLSLSSFTVLAAGVITATYSNGDVTITGSGFEPDTDYVIRILDENRTHIIIMLSVTPDRDGQINKTAAVGPLESGTFHVAVNDSNGDDIVSDTLRVINDGNGGNGNGNTGNNGNGGSSGNNSGDGSGNNGDSGGGGSGGGGAGGSSSIVRTGVYSTSDFGIVPQTGVPDITGLEIAMWASIILTVVLSTSLLSVGIYKMKYKNRGKF
jgi:uncharacterized membrane protein YgcG